MKKKDLFWKIPFGILLALFLVFYVSVGWFICLLFHLKFVESYFLFRFVFAFLNSTVLPAVTVGVSGVFLLKHSDKKERLCSMITKSVITIIGVSVVSWVVFGILDPLKAYLFPLPSRWSSWDYGYNLPIRYLLSPLQPQALLIHLVFLIPAAIGWRKNKQVAVSAPVSETADTLTE